jgi:putative transcriptional regulator
MVDPTMSSNISSLQNHFLIAMPRMEDPNFNGSITYLCQHNEEGAMGIILNRPSNILLGDIFEQLDFDSNSKNSENDVFQGGPVQLERGFVLHNDSVDWDSSFSITPDMRLTTSKDILDALAQDQGPKQFFIALGYAGWGAGQLEQEIAENTWLTCQADPKILFNTPTKEKYTKALASLGFNAGQLSSQAGHA